MRRRTWITALSAALSVSLPSVAMAENAVVSPFVGKAGVDSLQVLNITSLVSSEVDFSMSFDHVAQLEAMPAGMNVACLASSSCLSGVAKANSAQVVIAGSVAKVGEQFEIFMVNYHSSRGIVRKKSWKISADPTTMADLMSSLVNEILTGKSHEQEAKEDDISGLSDMGSADMFADEDEFAFDNEDLQVGRRVATPELSDYDLDDFELLDAEESGKEAQLAAQRRAAEEAAASKAEEARRRAAEEEARRRAEAEASRRAAEEDARRRAEEEARRRAEDERRRAAEEEDRRRAEEDSRRRAEDERRRRAEEERARAAVVEDDEDDFELSFAPVSAEDMGLDFADTSGLITVEPAEDDFSEPAGGFVADSYDDFDEFDALDSSPVRRVDSSFDDFDEVDALDSLDDDGFDAARVREQERARKEREREEAERRAQAAERAQREQDRRSSLDDDLDSGRSSYRGTGADNVIKSQYTERQRVAVTARVGTSGFQTLQFITYGGELAFGVGESARISTGLEAFSVKREFDADQCEVDPSTQGTVVGCTRWNTILPFHVGARYQRSDVKVRPYFGGDVTLTPYTEDFQIAFGFRGRAGVDFVPTEVFGINLNAGVGLLHGAEMQAVQKDMDNTGLLWQLSAGTVFML